jgi:hypothetical protein
MAARKISVVGIVFGILNILVALVPPCAGCTGASFFLKDQHIPFKNVDMGPVIQKHFEKELPAAKPEAIGSAICNCFLSLMLVAGAIGLFLNHEWGRWLSIGTALLLILTLCVHDIYQLAVVRPSLVPVFAKNLPPGPPGEAEGAQIGFTMSYFFWSWSNPAIMFYLLAMSITLGAMAFFRKPAAAEPESDRAQDRERDTSRRPRRYHEYDD